MKKTRVYCAILSAVFVGMAFGEVDTSQSEQSTESSAQLNSSTQIEQSAVSAAAASAQLSASIPTAEQPSDVSFTYVSKVSMLIAEAKQNYDNGFYWKSHRDFSKINKMDKSEFTEAELLAAETGYNTGCAWELNFYVSRLSLFFCLTMIALGMCLAKRGWKFTIRFIPGLNYIKDAIGRATEMGRPSMFCLGVSDMGNPETFASMPILTHIAKHTATLRNRLIIPVCAEKTLTLLQNTYREACKSVNEMRMYNPSDIRYFPGGQVYFAGATMGHMLREKPAACFYFGFWELESLLISETGQSVGAMQIAGTSSLLQIPFFIAACDYVIIGEEFYAVSASLSHEPILCGSLFGQDIVKIVFLIIIVIGTILCSLQAFASYFSSAIFNL